MYFLLVKIPFYYPVEKTIAWAAVALFLGSIPFGYLVARLYGQDIRRLGSGNIGMTNVWRSLGWRPGLLVFCLDVMKGLIPVLLFLGTLRPFLWNDVTGTPNFALSPPYTYYPVYVGLAAILGHTFTPWLKFKGGKGVATGLGVAIALYQVWILLPLAAFLVVLLVTRFVSLSSILAATVLATLSLPIHSLRHLWPFGVLVFLLVLYTHRSNIRRIIAGTESKVSFRWKQNSSGGP